MDVPKETFFGEERSGPSKHRPSLTSVDIRRAKAICAVCPVLQPCLQWAIEQDETYGVWGGTTPNERMDMVERSVAVQSNLHGA